MLHSYVWHANRLASVTLSRTDSTEVEDDPAVPPAPAPVSVRGKPFTSGGAVDPGRIVWVDLLDPTPEEGELVRKMTGIEIPTRAEMDEIELSARLYNEDGAEFMTATTLTALDGEDPIKLPVTFILKGPLLVTVRHAEPKPFAAFLARAQKPGSFACQQGESVMLGLLEAFIDRMADVLERVGNDVDGVSREVFRSKTSNVTKKTRDLQSLIEQIGRRGDLLTATRESLVSISRLIAYHAAPTSNERGNKENKQRIKLIQRDAASLGEHANFLSGKINFLLDATLGLINLEQNQIIKIFSVAAVVFLPPTLVASIYGMNFEIMPELKLSFGYPLAICLMILSAAMPYLYFKRRGWL
ncbi:magnesium transporter CorA family protein [Paracoccus aminophilus]|uniref:Magnesium transport protein CorA n=1 Tax=Paracoccus aminophilus JCM 7686 TaxID=1367847 RepID=S5Y102_PARAH|nr:magnesium transporter CorA family protein [Paracoccus aminophilus]AGT09390.1 magnesium/cobalt transport protein [Paracoccus aminophilus JCM 7686]